LQDLTDRIIEASQSITARHIFNVKRAFYDRLASNEGHFEQLIEKILPLYLIS